MNWYLSKIIFRIVCGNGIHTPQFDEQWRLVEAEDAHYATLKAQQIGRTEQHSFYNEEQELVKWKFIGVTEIHLFNKKLDGAEMFSQIVEAGDAEFYLKGIAKRIKMLNRSSEMIEAGYSQ